MPTWSELTGPWADQVGTWEGTTTSGLFVFNPPATIELPRVEYPIELSSERFWNHIRRGPVGTSVYKLNDGSYTTTLTRADDVVISYIGGHVYPVDATEAASLEAAGYDVDGFPAGVQAGVLTVDELTMTVDELIILVDDL